MSGLPLNNNWAGYKYSNNGSSNSNYSTPQNAIPDKMLNFDIYPLTNYTELTNLLRFIRIEQFLLIS